MKNIILILLFIIGVLNSDELKFNIKNYNYNSSISQIYILDDNNSKILMSDNNLSVDEDNNLSVDIIYGNKYSILIKTYSNGIYKYNFEDNKAYISSIETNTSSIIESSNNVFNFDASRLNFIEEKFYKQVSIGDNHTLAIKYDGTLWAWGNNIFGQLGNDSNISTYKAIEISNNMFKAISVGTNHSVAIDKDGYLYTWGNNLLGQLGSGDNSGKSIPTKINNDKYIAISANGDYTMAIKEDGTLWATGINNQGQLGIGNNDNQLSFTQVGTASNWIKVSAGYGHTLAINEDGELFSWGYNEFGQLGLDNTDDTNQPTKIGTDTDWKDITVGLVHSVALKTDGSVYSWGYNGNGELGLGDNDSRLVPTKISSLETFIVKIQAGVDFTVLLDKKAVVYTFGSNQYGQLALWDRNSHNTPQTLYSEMSGGEYIDIFAGGFSSVFSDAFGSTLSSGRNNYGQLGHPAYNKFSLTKIDNNYGYVKTSISSFFHGLAVDSYGSLYGWGDSSYGVLGDDTTEIKVGGQVIGLDTDWDSVKTSPFHSVALKTNGTLYSWGANDNNSTPHTIDESDDWTSNISLGNYHTLAIKSDGTLYSWGQNNYGQLGDGSNDDNIDPELVSDANWTKVSAGGYHSFAIKSDGTLYSWGQNTFGQLGDGTFDDNLTIHKISDDSWDDVSAGLDFTVAIKSDGTLWSCGNNTFGQLGDGTNDINATLHQVGFDSDWSKVKATISYVIALKSDGTLWGWGKNIGTSSLFNGENTNAPIQIGEKNNWNDIDAASTFLMVKNTENEIFVAGTNDKAQLGDFWITTPKRLQDIYQLFLYNDETIMDKSYDISLVDQNSSLYDSLNNNIFYLNYDNSYKIYMTFDNNNTYWYNFNDDKFYINDKNSTRDINESEYEIPMTSINISNSIPNAPINLSAEFINNYIELNWEDNNSNNLGFNLLRNSQEINNTLSSDTTSFTDSEIEPNINYRYIVEADNDFGYISSNEVNITTPYRMDNSKYIFSIVEEISLETYNDSELIIRKIPFDMYWINSFFEFGDEFQQTHIGTTIMLNDGVIKNIDTNYQNEIQIDSIINDTNMSYQEENGLFIITDGGNNQSKFELKFVKVLNSNDLKVEYLSYNMDINFSENAGANRFFIKNLDDELSLWDKIEEDDINFSSIDNFIDGHTLSSGNPFMFNDINCSRALVFENNSSNILFEIDSNTKEIINEEIGTWERIQDTKDYVYENNGTRIYSTTNDTLIFHFNESKGYNFQKAYAFVSNDNSIYEGEYKEQNTTTSEIALNSYAVNDIAKYLFGNNEIEVVQNPPYFVSTLSDINTTEDNGSIRISLSVVQDDNTTVTVVSNNQSIANVYIDENNSEIVIEPKDDEYGLLTIEVNATKGSESVIQSFDVNIEAVNDFPVISNIQDINLNEDFNNTILPINIYDVDGDELNITLEYNTSLISINSNKLNTLLNQSDYIEQSIDLNLSSISDMNGVVPVKVIVKDDNLSIFKYFNINILPVNDKPILEYIGNINIVEKEEYNITLNAIDVDNEQLFYSVLLDNMTLADVNISGNILSINPISNGITQATVNVTDGNLSDFKIFDINISFDEVITSNTDKLNLINGWNFVSFPTKNTICDSSIQNELTSICDQNYTLNSIFGDNEHIKYMFKYTDNWMYWDSSSDINSSYNLNKFSLLNNKDGFVIKSDATTFVDIPKNLSNDIDEFITLNSSGWYLVGVNEHKTVSQIEYLITQQNKTLMYIWMYRSGIWYLYTPLQIDSLEYPLLDSIESDEGFWIYIN